jgi:exonuclease SbcD
MDSVGPIDTVTRINGRVLDYLDSFDAIIDFAEQEAVDVAFFTGDLFHTNSPTPQILNEASKRLTRLAAICPVVMLVGNHDISRMDKPSSVEVYNTLAVPNIHVGNAYELLDIQTKSGMLTVGTLPYPTRQILGDDIRNRPVEKTQELIRAKMSGIIKAMVEQTSEDVPNVLLGHFTVNGATSGAESSMNMFSDATVNLEDLVDPCWSYVALGHIHKFQELNADPPVVYAGSIERVSFNEEHEDKGFIYGVITDAGYPATWEFVQLDARPYVTLSKNILKGDPTKIMLDLIKQRTLKDAVVRILVKMPAELRFKLDVEAIQEAVMAAGAYTISSCHIDARSDSMLRVSKDDFHPGMTPMELLKVYFEQVLDVSESEEASLVSLAESMMSEEVDYEPPKSETEEPVRKLRRRE